jgi:hypothetical protein
MVALTNALRWIVTTLFIFVIFAAVFVAVTGMLRVREVADPPNTLCVELASWRYCAQVSKDTVQALHSYGVANQAP